MNDMRREILNQVASGAISAEEGAARLGALDQPSSASGPSQAPVATVPQAAPAGTATRRVRVVAQFGSAEVIGDPSVDSAVAEGPHRVRYEGDMMVIEHQPFEESDTFTFGRGGDRRVVVNGFDWQRRRLVVRMNRDLALSALVQAGNLSVADVKGPIDADVQAGNCKIADFRGPLNVSVQAGNLSAGGRLDHGASKVRCEMGSVRVALDKGSSVRITAHTQLGKIAIDGPSGEHAMSGGAREVTLGTGEATLDIECTMGSVRVSAD